MRPPVEHTYSLDGQSYRLREATMEGQERIMQHYALSLSQAPAGISDGMVATAGQSQEGLWSAYARTLDLVHGQHLYHKAVTRECLVEAPPLWWTTLPAAPGLNGSAQRVITFKEVPQALWHAHREQVIVFLDAIFRADTEAAGAATGGSAAVPAVVASAETVSPVFRGRAE